MKFTFTKFFKDAENAHYALSDSIKSGRMWKFSKEGFGLVDAPADLTTLSEVTHEEWLAFGEPEGIEVHWANEPTGTPAERKLTPEEEKLDAEYRDKLADAKRARLDDLRSALLGATEGEAPLFTIEETMSTSYASGPAIRALAALVAKEPDPEDPIVWRRSAAKTDRLTEIAAIVNGLLEAAGPLISSFTGGKVSSASVRTASAPRAPAKKPEGPTP